MAKLIDGLTLEQHKTVNQGIGWLICKLGTSDITADVRRELVKVLGLGPLTTALVTIGYEEYCEKAIVKANPTMCTVSDIEAAKAVNVRSTVDILDPAYDSLADDENLNYQDVIDNSAAELACIERTKQQLIEVATPPLPEFDGMTPEERKEFKKSEAARLRAVNSKSKKRDEIADYNEKLKS
jgi:hypothetical protein